VRPEDAGRARCILGSFSLAVEIPSRITQSWIERTVPRLTARELDELLNAMRDRNWSDDDIAGRVLPYVHRGEADPLPPPAAITEVSIALPCPRGHRTMYTVDTSDAFLEGECSRCGRAFVAVVNVVCRGFNRERRSRTQSYYGFVVSKHETKVSAVIRIRYVNPHPPPVERLLEFVVRGSGAALQVRSGDRISVIFERKRKRLRPALLKSHTLGETWRLEPEGLGETLFDLAF
jgi:hypothetical protein